MDFNNTRDTYKKFIYKDYKIYEDNSKIYIEYHFEIEGLSEFIHKIEILKKKFKFKDLFSNIVKNIVFNLGMIEAISYFKCTCSPNFIINCGNLNKEQEEWYKKIYYLGLGEFRYLNNIEINIENFIHFVYNGENIEIQNIEEELEGFIIPVGGGKDSVVTLDLLKNYIDESYVFCIGSKSVSMECANIAGYENDKIIEVKRIIDNNLIKLNEKGFFNGHTPFSASVAFLTYLVSYLLGKKYVVLSNEDSANESNVVGEKINHQYSKSLEFENDFRFYAEKYLKANVEYFSLLRPITEFQIAMLFSKLEKFHKIFKSCNVGSKTEPWHWCLNCPKCLFVFIILSPFLYKEKLIDIFGEDLFEREDLLNTFIELCGYGETKPFECVGTYSEVRYAITSVIKNSNKKLPFLLQYYKDSLLNNDKELLSYYKDKSKIQDENLLKYYNENNNIPKEFESILKSKLQQL